MPGMFATLALTLTPTHPLTDYLHKKQSGGSGQYGGVKGYIEPLPADHPVKNEFKNAIIGTIIPQEFIPAIEKGFFEVCFHSILRDHIRLALFMRFHLNI